MKIEIINALTDVNQKGPAWQIEQVKSGDSDELWLATPHEDAVYLVKNLGLDPTKVFDIYAQAYLTDIDETTGIWWGDLSVPNDAQLVVYPDWSKYVISQGQVLAKVRWFGHSKRIVQAVVWQDIDGEIDYKDIYLRNGKLFAKQYFSEGQLLNTNFYFGQNNVMVEDYYFEGQRNFVYAQQQKYASAENYILHTLAQYPENDYRITQLQRVPNLSPKRTTLTIIDDIVDEQGRILPNLEKILKDDTHNVSSVLVDKKNYRLLRLSGLPVKKVHRLN